MTTRTHRTPDLVQASNRIWLHIAGMSCSSCVDHVRSALEGIAGIHVIDVRPGSAAIELEPEADSHAVVRAVAAAGYEVFGIRPFDAREPVVRRPRSAGGEGCCCGAGAHHEDMAPESVRR